jgi:hypothetical protein
MRSLGMGKRRIRFASVVVAMALAVAGPAAASAQDPAEGDFTWEFTARGIFADQRVLGAMGIFVDEAGVMAAAGLEGESLYYGDEEIRAWLAEVPAADAPLLLQAAGILDIDEQTMVEQVRVCQIWTPAGGPSEAEREALAAALGDEVARVWGALGVAVEPCEPAANLDEADLVVTVVGLTTGLPELPEFSSDSFLDQPSLPGAGPGGTGGGEPSDGGPAPAQGGNLGVFAPESSGAQVVAVLVALLAMVVLGGRWSTGRDSR